MHQPDPPHPPTGFERAKRMLFAQAEPSETVVVGSVEPADLTAAIERVVAERMQDAIGAIQEAAASLMHEVAAEVWHTARGDKRHVQAKLLESLTRDESIRSLIAHSDERFQALAVRAARLEETLQRLADHTYEATGSLTRGVHALEEAVQQPGVLEIGDLHDRLSNVVHQTSRALETIAERDRIIIEAIGERVREHGEVVTQETSRVSHAMEAYVQQGVSALGQLAGRVDGQLSEFTGHFDAQVGELVERVDDRLQKMEVSDESLQQHMKAAMQEQADLLGEKLELLHQQSGIEARDVHDALDRLDRHNHERAMNMARLVRSDSEKIRERLVRMTAEHDEALARTLDVKLERVSNALMTASEWTVEEVARRLRDETQRVMVEQAAATTDAMDRNMLRLSEQIGSQFAELGAVVGHQTEQAADAAITGRFEATLDGMSSSAAAIERAATDVQHAQRRSEEDLARLVDGRVTALARMIRSDNKALSDQMHQEQQAAKQSLRAVKELQANLPEEVLNVVERRIDAIAAQFHRDTQETTEQVARIADALERRIGEMGSKISQRYDNDIQVVIERMGDAMHALGSLGRAKPDRIDLE